MARHSWFFKWWCFMMFIVVYQVGPCKSWNGLSGWRKPSSTGTDNPQHDALSFPPQVEVGVQSPWTYWNPLKIEKVGKIPPKYWYYIVWLVICNMFDFFTYIENNNPNWLSYFSRWLKPPTSRYGAILKWGHPQFSSSWCSDFPWSAKPSSELGVPPAIRKPPLVCIINIHKP